MSNCMNCSIEDKLLNCCGSNPLTGRTKKMKFEGKYYSVCDQLNKEGLCSVYEQRHRICRDYHCSKMIQEMERETINNYIERMYSGLKIKPVKISKLRK